MGNRFIEYVVTTTFIFIHIVRGYGGVAERLSAKRSGRGRRKGEKEEEEVEEGEGERGAGGWMRGRRKGEKVEEGEGRRCYLGKRIRRFFSN